VPKGCVAETTVGSAPLTPVAKLPAGCVASVTFAFDGPALSGAPVLVPEKGPVVPL
jgi:hypothetical protein